MYPTVTDNDNFTVGLYAFNIIFFRIRIKKQDLKTAFNQLDIRNTL